MAPANHLRQALSGLAHHTHGGQRLQLPGLAAWAPLDGQAPAQQQLLDLARRLQP